MKVRDTAQFFTDLPDGAVEGEDDAGPDFLVWPGRPVAEALCEHLRALGCEVEPIESVDFKGWEFGFRYRGRRLWSRVTVIERHIACFVDSNFWPKMVGRKHALHIELLGRLSQALESDDRFHDVLWYGPDEVETAFEGARRPVG
jgi:hypothetical protein